ncbi:MAG: zinc-finger domain-containing protein [Rhodospirillales bacterium]|nr:zinc-finger domain-containing protein [Rhodospirillales bacterium]
MKVEETIIVEHSSVSCDGGGGPLGHPRVYLQIAETREIVCPYCSRTYKLAEGASQAAGH